MRSNQIWLILKYNILARSHKGMWEFGLLSEQQRKKQDYVFLIYIFFK